MFRSPSFQKELCDFLRKYPIFFRFQRDRLQGYGRAEKVATKEWENFLKENGGRVEQVEESDGTTYYKFLVRAAPDVTELEQLEAAVLHLEVRQWRMAQELYDVWPEGSVFSRVSTHIDRIPGISGDHATREYLSLAGCSGNDFLRAEEEFADKWNVFPHHVCPQQERVVLMRSELDGFNADVKLFIPISDVTTKEELGRRWREVASMQHVIYRKKKRPNRKDIETLLKIYDLRQAYATDLVAKKLGLSRSSVEKHYRQVYFDIHGVRPKKALTPSRPFQGRRKTRLGFPPTAATHEAAESVDEVLRRAFVELGFPLTDLHATHRLTKEQREQLKNLLYLRNQERHRRTFPQSTVRKNSLSQ